MKTQNHMQPPSQNSNAASQWRALLLAFSAGAGAALSVILVFDLGRPAVNRFETLVSKPAPSPQLPSSWLAANGGAGQAKLKMLEGVSGETYAPHILQADLNGAAARGHDAAAKTQQAHIELPVNLQIGDMLTLTATDGKLLSFRVMSKRAAPCAAPAELPATDIALLDCGAEAQANWQYAVEEASPPDGQKPHLPRTL